MRTNILSMLLTLLLGTVLSSCDKGLEPPFEGDVLLSGRVDFLGGIEKWPEADSIFDLRVVAFQTLPTENLVEDLINGRAWFSDDSLAYFVDTAEFEIVIPSPTPPQIKYLAVAMQNGPNILGDWIVIGVYAPFDRRDLPTEIPLQPGREVRDLAIQVDFEDLPPQPIE